MKTCNNKECKSNVPRFSPDKRNKDGLQGICNDCKNEKRKGKHKYNPTLQLNYARKKGLENARLITDVYVIAELKRGTSLTSFDIRKHPELIEAKRQVLINKRKIKDEKRKRTTGQPYQEVRRIRKVGRPKHKRTISFYSLCFGNH